MRKLLFLFLPLLFTLLISCDSNSGGDSKKDAIATYELAIIDSIEVDYMEGIRLLDYDAERNRFLGYNSRNGDYIEFDRTGEILNQVNLIGDGPNDHGRITYQVNYIKGGNLGVAAIGRYFTYDQDWLVENKVNYSFSGLYPVMGGGGRIAFGKPQGNNANNPYVVISGVGFMVSKKEEMSEPHLFYLNTETGEGDYFHQFPDSSIFIKSDQFYIGMMDNIMSYNYEQKVLDVIHVGEPVLYRYEISGAAPKLLDSYRFDFDNPSDLRGVPFDSPPQVLMGGSLIRDFNQKLTSLYSFDDKQLVIYKERHPLSEIIDPNETNQETLMEFYNTEIRSWAYLIKDGQRISENILLAKPNIALQLGKGRFLSTNYVDPEIERDTQLFYIYELREVDN